jgi:hypothetical protein
VKISGGTLVLSSSGSGGKGINSDGTIEVSGGNTTITTTGGKYKYSSSLTSSPKGMKADGNVTISGGVLNIAASGTNDGAEALESKGVLTISGGETYCYAYDDAINASSAINITGGKVYAYGINNDGIDSNGSLTISGGLVVAAGTTSPESGIDCDSSNNFKINGGTVIGLGGSLQSSPSSSSSQNCVVYNGISASQGKLLSVLDSSGSPILTYKFPRTLSSSTVLISSPNIKTGSSYTISSGGTLTSPTEEWNCWMSGGTWSGGTTLKTITPSSRITTIGSSNNGGGGGFGTGGGWH